MARTLTADRIPRKRRARAPSPTVGEQIEASSATNTGEETADSTGKTGEESDDNKSILNTEDEDSEEEEVRVPVHTCRERGY